MKYFSYLSKMLKVNPTFYFYCMGLCVYAHRLKSDDNLGVGSFFPPQGFQGLNLGHKVWQVVPSPLNYLMALLLYYYRNI